MLKFTIILYLLLSLLISGCNNSVVQSENKKESTMVTATDQVITPTVTTLVQELTPAVTPLPTEEITSNGIPVVNTITILLPRPVSTLDPYLMKTINPEDSLAAHIWDTLVWINDELVLEPRLASSWRLVNDTTWEFKLRPDVTFHNGQPFNAAAVKFSFERAAKMEGGLETLVNDVGLLHIEIVDDYTVQFVTAQPDASLPYQMANIEILPSDDYSSGVENLTSTPVGSGPYRFERQEGDGSIILEANPDYWQGAPVITTLIFRPVADPDTRLKLLLTGEAQLATNLSVSQVAALNTEQTRAEIIESTRRLFVGIRFGLDSPVDDKQVRQALNYAIDVDSLVKEFAGGYGQRYGSWVNSPYQTATLTPWPYDPTKAKALLAEAGYTNGFEITLDTPVGRYEQDQAIAEAIAKQLALVGVQVKVQPYDWSKYVTEHLLPKKTSPLFLLSLASRGDGLTDVTNLSADFPFNPTMWQNAQFQDLVVKVKSTFNDTQRQTLLDQAQGIAYEESPWLWLWRPYDFYGVAVSLDWQPRADGLIYLYHAKNSN